MRRLLAVVLGALVVLGGIFALLSVFSARDDADVTRTQGPGIEEPDRGARHAPAEDRATADPPTSGPHQPQLVTADARELSDDRILHALELGDVVLAYPGARPPAALRRLQQDVAGPFDPEVAAAGQAIVLARAPGIDGVQALAWRHRLRARGADDPALQAFADYWLGRGLDGRR